MSWGLAGTCGNGGRGERWRPMMSWATSDIVTDAKCSCMQDMQPCAPNCDTRDLAGGIDQPADL